MLAAALTLILAAPATERSGSLSRAYPHLSRPPRRGHRGGAGVSSEVARAGSAVVTMVACATPADATAGTWRLRSSPPSPLRSSSSESAAAPSVAVTARPP